MKTDKQTLTMHMEIIIKIGVVGKFTNHNLEFLPEGKVVDFFKSMFYDYYDKNIQQYLSLDKRNMPRGAREHILEAVPLLFFQNNLPLHSALEVGFVSNTLIYF